jgi:hypothetical protein
MSLKFFHIVFITVSTLLCLFVALWALDAYRADGQATWVGLAAVAVAGGGFLVVYGTRFLQKTRKLGIAGLLVAGTLGAPADLLACAVCLGNTQSSLRDGMNAGILALLGFAGFMIASFAVFFIYLARRARQASQDAGSNFDVPGSEGERAHA